MRFIFGLLIAACGPDAVSRGAVDARRTGDSGNEPGVTDVTCTTYKNVTTAADNSKTERRIYYALVDGIDPEDDDFRVGLCDPQAPLRSDCNGAAGCVDVGTPPPPSNCSWTRGLGNFTSDGKLIVNCGSGQTNTNANGTVTFTFENKFGRVLVKR